MNVTSSLINVFVSFSLIKDFKIIPEFYSVVKKWWIISFTYIHRNLMFIDR